MYSARSLRVCPITVLQYKKYIIRLEKIQLEVTEPSSLIEKYCKRKFTEGVKYVLLRKAMA